LRSLHRQGYPRARGEMFTRTTIIDDEEHLPDQAGEGLHVLVVAQDWFAEMPLPDSGEILIGRTTSSDIQIDDSLVSRRHARLTIGDGLTLEDLDSTNGTRVAGQSVEGGQIVPVAEGQPIGIGSAVLIVGRGPWSSGRRRIWSHVQFEARLATQCERAAAAGEAFALLRLRVDKSVDWMSVFPILARAVSAPHVLGPYAPNEFEALFLGVTAGAADAIVENVVERLQTIRARPHIALAWYPRDGRSADALLARANALLRPPVSPPSLPRLTSWTPAMASVMNDARRAAASNINILILGETGVGKEVLAQAIHRESPRAANRIVSLNCAGLAESLVESELFGTEKGAFTGANAARVGLLETADGGTVFLDEVGEMPIKVQATLLRAIETREVLPIGGRQPRPVNVRFIAATNRDLEAAVAKGEFRQDLYFRLNGISLTIPPLRQRRAEIPDLARDFVERACRESDRAALAIAPEALVLLERYSWPGNIRELRNVIERAIVLCDDDEIGPEHLPVEKMTAARGTTIPVRALERATPSGSLHVGLSQDEAAEKQRIVAALNACAGNQSRAATMLGVSRRKLLTRLDFFGIPRPQKVGPATGGATPPDPRPPESQD
jgi:two-component system, NtrC family, response regulator AtoC